jgi:hypothetical protein
MIKQRRTIVQKKLNVYGSKGSLHSGVDLVNFFNSGVSEQGDYAANSQTYRSPCRRTCSTSHNPMFHNPRFNLNIVSMRPNSAERTKDQKKKALLKIDFHETKINRVVEDVQREKDF